MSFTQTTTPDGRKETRCDVCQTTHTSSFVEVLQTWARSHVCPSVIAAAHAARAARRAALSAEPGRR